MCIYIYVILHKSYFDSVMNFEFSGSPFGLWRQGTPVFTRRRMTKAPYNAKDTNAAEPMANPCCFHWSRCGNVR